MVTSGSTKRAGLDALVAVYQTQQLTTQTLTPIQMQYLSHDYASVSPKYTENIIFVHIRDTVGD